MQATLPPFRNEAFTDFADPQIKENMTAAIAAVTAQLGRTYGTLAAEQVVSVNPARPAQVIGTHAAATPAEIDAAIQTAQEAFATWSAGSAQERAALLVKAAGMVRERHLEFCAWLVLEVGKNWAEADADVGECIDFLEFYAREALRLDAAITPIQFPGERNQLRYVPLGVGAVIPPWNFPFAIMAGMTAASIVCGNTVVLKPSPDAPTVAERFVALMTEAGLPGGVINLLQGGAEVGSALVESKHVRFIAFTGSKKVGLEIHERAARTQPGQRFIKRTILELGGKDAIIVDADCDLDAAVEGVAVSAFGFGGQKCSACSRAIVDERVYDAFCDKLAKRVASIQVGDPADNAYGAPVINTAAFERVLRYIEIGNAEGKLIAGGTAVDTPGHGYFVAPTVFRDIAKDSRLAQEEVFGPVLAVLRSKDFDDALRIANDTDYGLTGAVYTSSRAKLERARREFHVGNLYMNRKCTGAMVGAHPFGGFNLSGTDSKAGGPDYLLLFTQGKSVAEKVGVVSAHDEEEEQRMGL